MYKQIRKDSMKTKEKTIYDRHGTKWRNN